MAPWTRDGVAIVGGRVDDQLVAYAVRLDGATVSVQAIEADALSNIAWGHLTLDGTPAVVTGKPIRMTRASARPIRRVIVVKGALVNIVV